MTSWFMGPCSTTELLRLGYFKLSWAKKENALAYLRSATKLFNHFLLFEFLFFSLYLISLPFFPPSYLPLPSLCSCIFFKIVFSYMPKLYLHSPPFHILSQLQGQHVDMIGELFFGLLAEEQGRNQELSFEDVIFRMLMKHHSGGVKRGNTFES